MKSEEVAHYLYDEHGRLRSEWDPRISPHLETTYGYDAEGHVTAISPPGGETLALTYGPIYGDLSTGRLLKLTRAPASAPVWTGEVLAETKEPLISGSSTVGTRLAASDGAWSGNPVVFGFQWEDCNSSGAECAPISGATNANYTPTTSDVGHTLVVQVTATNGGGSTTVSSGASKTVDSLEQLGVTYNSSFGSFGSESGQLLEPTDLATDASGNVWVADAENDRLEEWNSKGEFVRSVGSYGTAPGQFAGLSGVTVDSQGNIWVSETKNDRIDEFSSGGVFEHTYGSLGSGNGQFYCPEGLVVDSKGNIYVADRGNHRVEELNSEGKYVRSISKSEEKEGPFDVKLDSSGNLWVSYAWESKIAEFSPEGALLRLWGTKGAAPGDLEDAYRIKVGPEGNIWVAEWGNNRIQVFNQNGEYLFAFGSDGSGEGQFFHARGVSISGANVYALDSGEYWHNTGNARIEKWERSEEGEAQAPQSGSTIEYNVPLSGNSELPTMTEKEITEWGQKDNPVYATAIFPPDQPQTWPAGSYSRADVYYMDAQARTINTESPGGGVSTTEYNEYNDVVRTLSAVNREAALKEATKSAEVAKLLDTESVYSEDGSRLIEAVGPQHAVKIIKGNAKVPSGSEVLARNHVKYYYDEGAPSEGGPYDLVTKTTDGAETAGKEEFDVRTSTTSYSGQNNLGWKLRSPTSDTTAPESLKLTNTTVYSEQTGNVVETVKPSGAYSFGQSGSEPGSFSSPEDIAASSAGDLYVADAGNDRIEEFNPEGFFIRTWGSYGSGDGQFGRPENLTVDSKGNVWVSDKAFDRIQEFTPEGKFIQAFGSGGSGNGELSSPDGVAVDSSGNVWVADLSNRRIEEFNSEGKFVRTITTFGEGGKETLWFPESVAIDSGGHVWVADTGDSRILELTSTGELIRKFGTSGTGNGEFKEPRRISIGPEGNIWVSDSGNDRVQVFTPTGEYKEQFGSLSYDGEEGKFYAVYGVAFYGNTVYTVDDGNDRIEMWTRLSGTQTTIRKSPETTQTTYYTPGTEAKVAACQNHPEWDNLPCQTGPAAQPEESAAPQLPVTTVSYDMLDQPETVEEVFGSSKGPTKRTRKTTFDESGRPLTSEISSSTDTSVPAITDHYESNTGALVKQTETVKGNEEAITSAYNTLGQLESYTDANGSTTTYKYDVDGRVTEMAIWNGTEEKGKQTYTYDPVTGFRTKLVDSTAGTFTASYNVAGAMTSETYPDGLTATYTRNPAGQTTSLEYVKGTHCEHTCPETWFKDTDISSIYGETVKQISSLAEEPNYVYDEAGRLTEVQEIPVGGKGCKVRLYSYDPESNRVSLTSREPTSEDKCATEGGSVETHTYDEANRLVDTGISYDAFGNTTTLPAADAGGSAITSTYYVDSQVASQTQNEQTTTYYMDPSGRVNETEKKSEITITHFSAPGTAPSWTSEPGEKWTRDIPGIDGTLSAVQGNTGRVTLQIHDLQGNVVGQAEDNETATKLTSTYDSTEFGVPLNGTPPKYAWLGALGVSSETSSGFVVQDGSTYVPQTGRALQTESITPPIPQNYLNEYVSSIEAGFTGATAANAAQQVINAEQAKRARELANKPVGAGATFESPEEEGGEEEEEGGEPVAVAASSRRSRMCSIQVVIGEDNGTAYAKGWVSCGGALLPRYAELEVCISWWGWRPGEPKWCHLGGSGFNPYNPKEGGVSLTSLLIVQVGHECEPVAFAGSVWFWAPGLGKNGKRNTRKPGSVVRLPAKQLRTSYGRLSK
jgi:YD repeat-containing protein